MGIIIIILTLVAIAIILNEMLTIFVDSVVGQVHEKVVNVTLFGFYVRFGCKSGKTVFEKENTERIHPIKKNVYSKVKFQIIYQERIVEVSLSNVVFRRINIIRIPCQKNALSLTRSFRLNYKSYILHLSWWCLRKSWPCKLRFEFIVLYRQNIGYWEEIIKFGEQLPHLH